MKKKFVYLVGASLFVAGLAFVATPAHAQTATALRPEEAALLKQTLDVTQAVILDLNTRLASGQLTDAQRASFASALGGVANALAGISSAIGSRSFAAAPQVAPMPVAVAPSRATAVAVTPGVGSVEDVAVNTPPSAVSTFETESPSLANTDSDEEQTASIFRERRVWVPLVILLLAALAIYVVRRGRASEDVPKTAATISLPESPNNPNT